jgi:hypothetical protein
MGMFDIATRFPQSLQFGLILEGSVLFSVDDGHS